MLLVVCLHADTAADEVLEATLFEADKVDALLLVYVLFAALEVVDPEERGFGSLHGLSLIHI